VFAVELTGRLDAVLPLLIGASAAYTVSVLTLKRSVLTEKIARRGYHLSREYDVDPLEVLFVREVMTTDVVSFRTEDRVDDVVATFVSGRRQLRDPQHRQRLYPVVDAIGIMHGVLTRRDVLDQALCEDINPVGLEQMLIDDPVVAFPGETLRTVANRMASSGVTRMPVVERATRRVVGVVSLAQLLQARLRDVQEARDAEQVLRFRLVMPIRRASRRGRVPVS
jgi:chloride channel protein, CIC family